MSGHLRALLAGLVAIGCWLPGASVAQEVDAGADAQEQTADVGGHTSDTVAEVADEPDVPASPAPASGPLATLEAGDTLAVAKVLGVLPAVLEDAAALAEFKVGLEKSRDATASELDGIRKEIEWTQKLQTRLEKKQAEADAEEDAGPVVEPAPKKKKKRWRKKPVPPPVELPPKPRIADQVLAEMEREAATQRDVLEKRLEFETASLVYVETTLEALSAKIKDDAADARQAEARAARAAVEKERQKTEAATNHAQEALDRVKAEQKRARHFKKDYRELAELDTQIRSEEILILARVQDELFRDIEDGNKVVTELAAERSAVDAQVADIAKRIESGAKTDIARREAGDLYDELAQRRDRARARTFYSKRLLDTVNSRLDIVEDKLDDVVIAAAASRKAAGAEPDNRIKQKAASVDEASRSRLRAHQLLLDHRSRLYTLRLAVVEDEVHFAKRTQIVLHDLIPESKLSQVHELSDANLRGISDEAVDLFIELIRHAALRTKQVANVFDAALSLAGLWWIIKALLALVGLYLGLGLIRRRRYDIVDSLSRRALKVRWLRARQTPVVKTLQLGGAIAGPVSVLLAVYVVLWLFPPDAPAVIVLTAVANGILFYVIAIRALRTLALPRWYRNTAEGATTVFSATERSKTANQPPELQRAIFFVATVRMLLLYTVVCQVVLFLVREALGLFFVGNVVHLLGVLGYVVVIYVLLSRWRDTIARMFTAQLAGTSERAVTFVETHKDKIYGIVVIFVAFLYVVVLEGWRFGSRYVTNLEVSKKVQNFLFRRRIEYRKSQEEKEESPDRSKVDIPLPTELIDLFKQKPLTDEGFMVERPEHETLRKAIASWKQGNGLGHIALVGFSGAGKTTSLNQAARQLDPEDALASISLTSRVTSKSDFLVLLEGALGLDGIEGDRDVDSVIAATLAAPRAIILIDDAHRLFLRKIGGFEALNALDRIVTATSHRHLWIVSYDGYAWTYLRHAHRKPVSGPNIIHVQKWSDDALRVLVDQRMDQTPLEATFEALDLNADPSQDRLVNLDQSAGGYFRLLEEATRGNPRVAMEYWLSSLQPTEGGELRVDLFQPLPKKHLAKLNDHTRFVLVTLIQHGELGLDEIATALNYPPSLVADVLAVIEDMGIAHRDPEFGTISVNTKTYSPVTDFLENQNLLHVWDT